MLALQAKKKIEQLRRQQGGRLYKLRRRKDYYLIQRYRSSGRLTYQKWKDYWRRDPVVCDMQTYANFSLAKTAKRSSVLYGFLNIGTTKFAVVLPNFRKAIFPNILGMRNHYFRAGRKFLFSSEVNWQIYFGRRVSHKRKNFIKKKNRFSIFFKTRANFLHVNRGRFFRTGRSYFRYKRGLIKRRLFSKYFYFKFCNFTKSLFKFTFAKKLTDRKEDFRSLVFKRFGTLFKPLANLPVNLLLLHFNKKKMHKRSLYLASKTTLFLLKQWYNTSRVSKFLKLNRVFTKKTVSKYNRVTLKRLYLRLKHNRNRFSRFFYRYTFGWLSRLRRLYYKPPAIQQIRINTSELLFTYKLIKSQFISSKRTSSLKRLYGYYLMSRDTVLDSQNKGKRKHSEKRYLKLARANPYWRRHKQALKVNVLPYNARKFRYKKFRFFPYSFYVRLRNRKRNRVYAKLCRYNEVFSSNLLSLYRTPFIYTPTRSNFFLGFLINYNGKGNWIYTTAGRFDDFKSTKKRRKTQVTGLEICRDLLLEVYSMMDIRSLQFINYGKGAPRSGIVNWLKRKKVVVSEYLEVSPVSFNGTKGWLKRRL